MSRFAMRAWHKELKKMYEIRSISYYHGIIKRIEVNAGDGSILIFDEFENNIDKVIVMQCTGMKDDNKTLIYESDIVKYADCPCSDALLVEWEYAKVVHGGEYNYPAFDLEDTDFDGTNGLSYIYGEGWNIEVVGNIYENPELLIKREDVPSGASEIMKGENMKVKEIIEMLQKVNPEAKAIFVYQHNKELFYAEAGEVEYNQTLQQDKLVRNENLVMINLK